VRAINTAYPHTIFLQNSNFTAFCNQSNLTAAIQIYVPNSLEFHLFSLKVNIDLIGDLPKLCTLGIHTEQTSSQWSGHMHPKTAQDDLGFCSKFLSGLLLFLQLHYIILKGKHVTYFLMFFVSLLT
jgi:hypothetical protein